jgi:hypothetical protein
VAMAAGQGLRGHLVAPLQKTLRSAPDVLTQLTERLYTFANQQLRYGYFGTDNASCNVFDLIAGVPGCNYGQCTDITGVLYGLALIHGFSDPWGTLGAEKWTVVGLQGFIVDNQPSSRRLSL